MRAKQTARTDTNLHPRVSPPSLDLAWLPPRSPVTWGTTQGFHFLTPTPLNVLLMTFSCSDSSYFHPSFSFPLAYERITVPFTVK